MHKPETADFHSLQFQLNSGTESSATAEAKGHRENTGLRTNWQLLK